MPGVGIPAPPRRSRAGAAGEPPRTTATAGFDEFKGDIEDAERRVAREIDPGARALVVAILVFVILLVLRAAPHRWRRGLDVLVGDDSAIREAIALPSRVFVWLILVFSVGFSILALLTRRWGAGVDRPGRVAVASSSGCWRCGRVRPSPENAPGPGHRPGHRVDRGHPAGVPLGEGGMVAHRGAAGRRGGAPPGGRRAPEQGHLESSTTSPATTVKTGAAGEALALLAERLDRRLGPLPPLRGVGPGLLGVLGAAGRFGLGRLTTRIARRGP